MSSGLSWGLHLVVWIIEHQHSNKGRDQRWHDNNLKYAYYSSNGCCLKELLNRNRIIFSCRYDAKVNDWYDCWTEINEILKASSVRSYSLAQCPLNCFYREDLRESTPNVTTKNLSRLQVPLRKHRCSQCYAKKWYKRLTRKLVEMPSGPLGFAVRAACLLDLNVCIYHGVKLQFLANYSRKLSLYIGLFLSYSADMLERLDVIQDSCSTLREIKWRHWICNCLSQNIYCGITPLSLWRFLWRSLWIFVEISVEILCNL